eukprot:CAMPEP_0177654474 /NCGR_PEP_ID=MMETSP0447-20121125/14353_1 /TAXON_ID=0 /ORGANISM="Stygamoeba regulata, Strain BSH-02190019" /LENGTH=79 /DNA_ID=CAMNT_0019158129 /DNA_START=257 /DNA_END=494 /DNA_ORIENTATION=-
MQLQQLDPSVSPSPSPSPEEGADLQLADNTAAYQAGVLALACVDVVLIVCIVCVYLFFRARLRQLSIEADKALVTSPPL